MANGVRVSPNKSFKAHSDDLYSKFADLMDSLQELAREKGLSASDIAEIMHASTAQIEEFEHYDSDPTLRMVRLYALAIGADISFTVSDRAAKSDVAQYAKTSYSTKTVSRKKFRKDKVHLVTKSETSRQWQTRTT